MKFMWNNRRSQFMLVRISFGGVRRLVIPIPLFVLDMTLYAIADLAWLAELSAPLWKPKLKKFLYHPQCGKATAVSLISPRLISEMVIRFFDELRKYGRWRMAEVKTDKVCVYLDFY